MPWPMAPVPTIPMRTIDGSLIFPGTCCAFFQEGTHALLLVVAVEQQLEGLALQRQGLVQRQVGAGQTTS